MSCITLPEISCNHNSREQMFHTVIQGAYECFKMWKVVSQTNSNWDQPPKDLLDEMNSQPAHLQWIKNICLIFYNQRYKCKKCSHQTGCNFSDHTPLRDQEKHDLDSSTTTQNNRLPLPDPLPLDIGVVENASTPEPTYNHLSINFDDYGSAPLNTQQAPLVSTHGHSIPRGYCYFLTGPLRGKTKGTNCPHILTGFLQ